MTTIQMSVRPEDLSQVPTGSERIPEAGILVIFGASGDLNQAQTAAGALPPGTGGAAARAVFHCGRGAAAAGRCVCGRDARGHHRVWRRGRRRSQAGQFIGHIGYFALRFDEPGDYAGLKAELERIDKEKGLSGKRIFYLATAPEQLCRDY